MLLSSTAFAATPSSGQESLLDNVPEAAVGAMVVRKSALSLARTFLDSSPGMKQEMGAYLGKQIGVDLTNVEGLAAWSTQLAGQPTWALLLRLSNPGVLKGAVRSSFDGTDLVALGPLTAAVVPQGILLGTESEVRVGIAVAHHKAAGITSKARLGALTEVDRSADIASGLLASAIGDAQTVAMAQQYGVQLITLVVRNSGLITLEVSGDAQRLESARTLLNNGAQVMLQQLKLLKDRAVAEDGGDVMAGIGTISSYYQATAFWKEFAPKSVGGKLQSTYQLPEIKTAGAFVPMIGIASAVAIPAFTKYIRRSKTVEATVNVRKLYDGAVAWAEGQANRKKPGFAFPRSTGWTPSRGCCGQPGDKCAPDPKAWKDPTWQALGFSVDDPHHYQYRVTSDGKGRKARIVVEARGDLDCDGKFSSFKRTGTIGEDGAISGGSGLEIHDEME